MVLLVWWWWQLSEIATLYSPDHLCVCPKNTRALARALFTDVSRAPDLKFLVVSNHH